MKNPIFSSFFISIYLVIMVKVMNANCSGYGAGGSWNNWGADNLSLWDFPIEGNDGNAGQPSWRQDPPQTSNQDDSPIYIMQNQTNWKPKAIEELFFNSASNYPNLQYLNDDQRKDVCLKIFWVTVPYGYMRNCKAEEHNELEFAYFLESRGEIILDKIKKLACRCWNEKRGDIVIMDEHVFMVSQHTNNAFFLIKKFFNYEDTLSVIGYVKNITLPHM